LGQFFPVSWDHSLGPDGETEKFQGFVGMKEHPDRQPRRAVAMKCSDHDPGKRDNDFVCKWIYDSTSA
jgi:hypothetical protein